MSHVAVHRRATPRAAYPSPSTGSAGTLIRDAEDRDLAMRAVDAFADDYGAKWSKAVAKIVEYSRVGH